MFPNYHVILVDDGSNCPVKKSFSNYPDLINLKIVRNDINKGQGFAIEEGVKLAIKLGADIFCTVDGDGQHDLGSCNAIIQEFSLGKYDIILGSRFLKGNSEVPTLKKIFLKGGILINYFYSGLLLHDAHCGLRVFGKQFAEKIHFFNLRQAHASEILWIIKQNNFSHKEFAVKIIYTKYSLNKGQSVWNSFRILRDLVRHKASVK